MSVRYHLAQLTMLSAFAHAGCFPFAIDAQRDVARGPVQSLPDDPVNVVKLSYETRYRTPYYIQGPRQTAMPGILPRGTRVEILDEPHPPGYVAIRTETGVEAFVTVGAIRKSRPPGLQLGPNVEGEIGSVRAGD